MPDESKTATTVVKALDILSLLNQQAEGMRLVDLVSQSGIARPSVVRFLQTLIGYGLVEKRERLYHITPFFFDWAGTETYSRIKRQYRSTLELLAQETGELVLLGIRRGNAIVHIDFIESDQAVRVAPAPITRHDLSTNAMGKLALSQTTHLRSKASKPKLRKELLEIDRTGIAWNREESNEGMIALASWAGTKDSSSPMFAVAWPKQRFTEKRAQAAIKLLQLASQRSSNRSL